MSLASALQREAAEFGVELTAEQVTLACRHAELLLEWNRRTNLTRLTAPSELFRRHFVESFLAARVFSAAPRLLDIGSGAGFPGLAARVVRPDLEITLLEPRAAKAAFLATASSAYPPPRPRVLPRRLEALGTDERWDTVTTRALKVSPESLRPLLSPGGRVVTFPGKDDDGVELERSGFRLTDDVELPEGLRAMAWSLDSA